MATQNWLALFPGQGSQHIGMAKILYQEFAVVREIFEEASDAISVDLKHLCFDGFESDLQLTENTQPCLLTASIASYRVAEQVMGFKPSLVAGHSLGEYSALVAAGALTLPTAVRWVRHRGTVMQQAVPAGEGGMAALMGLEDEAVRELCTKVTEFARSRPSELSVESVLEPANFNSPGQVVVAGSADALLVIQEVIKTASADASYAKGKVIPLKVSAPFHCKLMRPAREEMEKKFAGTPQAVQSLRCGYIPNRTARITHENSLILPLLAEQIDHPVLWKQSMQSALQSGYQLGVEFGPGKVLQGLMKRIAQSENIEFSPLGMSDVETLKALEARYAHD